MEKAWLPEKLIDQIGALDWARFALDRFAILNDLWKDHGFMGYGVA